MLLHHPQELDLKRLTEIETKQKQKVELSDSDLRFLYELDGPIEGFGYNKDPRVKKIMHGRANIRGDLAKLFACRPEEISLTREEALSGGIQYHHGIGTIRGRTYSTEFKFISGKSKWRSTVAIGIIE